MKPLTRCPECRYSLKGLPADHRCPECSFEYDAETAMWKGRVGKNEILGYVFGWMAFWFLLSLLFGTPIASRPNPQVATLFVIGGLALFVLYRVRQMRRDGDVVCTTRQGVWIKSGRRIDLYAYSEIDDVFWKTSNRKRRRKDQRPRPAVLHRADFPEAVRLRGF